VERIPSVESPGAEIGANARRSTLTLQGEFEKISLSVVPLPDKEADGRLVIETMNYNQILPRVFVGTCPASTEDIDRLKQDLGITAVLNLQMQDDFDYWDIDWGHLESHYARFGPELVRVPVRDFDRDDLRRSLPRCVEALRELLDGGHTVYAHCTEGKGRSPSVVITYLHWVEGWSLPQAVDHVRQHRTCVPNLEAIQLATEDRASQ